MDALNATAYDIYKECCTGSVSNDWQLSTPLDFHRFRERLAVQMLTYSPKELKYPGDEKFWMSTRVPKAKRRKKNQVSSDGSYTTSTGVDKTVLEQGAEGRVCGFLDSLLEHEKSMRRYEKRKHLQCACCGKATYFHCTLCPGDPPLHLTAPPGQNNSCFVHYHNLASFGLWKGDWKIRPGQMRRDWTYPTEEALRESSRQMKRLHEEARSATATTTAPAINNTPQYASRARASEQEDPHPINYNNVV